MSSHDDDQAEYRIEYAIQRRLPGEDDFTEIGFGSSSSASDLDAAVYAIESDIGNGIWETEAGQPDPDDVMADIQQAREAR